MGNVRDMLLARKQEIGTKIAPLFAETARLRKSLVETEGTISELNGELKQIETALKALDEAEAKKKPITIMEAVLEILRHKPNGMTAQEILMELNEKYFDGKIARHSLSPQLSRLKDRDKKLELRGNRWFRLPDEPTLFAPKR
jgi:predicted nuclease with TOPRIM domain